MTRSGSDLTVVETCEGVGHLCADWKRLSAITPLSSAFESWSWLSTYCAELLPPSAPLRVMVVNEAGREPSAIFPMAIDRGGTARFLGAGVGQLDFVCLATPEQVMPRLPRMFELFTARWKGHRISGGFTTWLWISQSATSATRRLGAPAGGRCTASGGVGRGGCYRSGTA